MKLLVFVLTVLSLTSIAQAKIAGLPKQLKGGPERQIQFDIYEEISNAAGCDLTEDASLKAVLTVTQPELQDPEYAEYKGELSSFVLNAKLVKSCAKFSECDLKFDLYDERAYEPNRQTLVCK